MRSFFEAASREILECDSFRTQKNVISPLENRGDPFL
jgi:hypothetical protein